MATTFFGHLVNFMSDHTRHSLISRMIALFARAIISFIFLLVSGVSRKNALFNAHFLTLQRFEAKLAPFAGRCCTFSVQYEFFVEVALCQQSTSRPDISRDLCCKGKQKEDETLERDERFRARSRDDEAQMISQAFKNYCSPSVHRVARQLCSYLSSSCAALCPAACLDGCAVGLRVKCRASPRTMTERSRAPPSDLS